MTAEVFGGVLAFPVRVVGGRVQDSRAVARGLLVVAVGVLDAHEDGARRRVALAPLDCDHGSVAEDELCAVIADPEALRESEGSAEPVARGAHVVVRELGNDLGVGNGPIGNHSGSVTESDEILASVRS